MERYTSCKVELQLFDTTAHEDSTLSVDNIQSFSVINSLKQRNNAKKFITLEENHTLLDGSYSELNEENVGYVSEGFTATITSVFTNYHSSAGLTLHFYDVYPRTVEISFYDGDRLLKNKTFYPNRLVFVADIECEDYKRIEIHMVGDSFIRIDHLDYGIALVYGEGQDKMLKKCTITEEIDVLSKELSVNESSVEIIDQDNLFKITNPRSYYRFLQKRQLFRISEIIDNDEIFIANHYLKEWTQDKDHLATFKLQDVLGLMSDTTFYGGIYSNATLTSVIDEIMASYGYSEYEIDNELANVLISGYIPICSHREALQQVAFACGAMIDTSRSEKIKIIKPQFETLSIIGRNRKLTSKEHSVTQSDLVTGVSVMAHSYTYGGSAVEVYKNTLEQGKYRITFNNPCTNIRVTNGTLIESNCNYALINTNGGEVTITANEYQDTTYVYTHTIDDLPSATDENILKVEEARLVNKSNARTVAENIYAIEQYRLSHSLKIINTEELAGRMYALAVGEEYAPLLITKMTTDLTGGFVSDVEGIGYALKIIDGYRATNYANANMNELYANDGGLL